MPSKIHPKMRRWTELRNALAGTKGAVDWRKTNEAVLLRARITLPKVTIQQRHGSGDER